MSKMPSKYEVLADAYQNTRANQITHFEHGLKYGIYYIIELVLCRIRYSFSVMISRCRNIM